MHRQCILCQYVRLYRTFSLLATRTNKITDWLNMCKFVLWNRVLGADCKNFAQISTQMSSTQLSVEDHYARPILEWTCLDLTWNSVCVLATIFTLSFYVHVDSTVEQLKMGYRAKRSTTFDRICDDADCKLFTRITGNTQHLLYPLLPLNASITTLSLFVNAVTTFNYLIVHPLLETKTLLRECCIVICSLLTIFFLALIHCVTAFLSVILLKLKWNEMNECSCIKTQKQPSVSTLKQG